MVYNRRESSTAAPPPLLLVLRNVVRIKRRDNKVKDNAGNNDRRVFYTRERELELRVIMLMGILANNTV